MDGIVRLTNVKLLGARHTQVQELGDCVVYFGENDSMIQANLTNEQREDLIHQLREMVL